MKTIGVALYGFGTVGSALARVLRARARETRERFGLTLELRRVVVRDRSRPRVEALPAGVLGTDPRLPLRDPGVGVVVEAISGVEAAGTILSEGLRSGRDVVTANKAVMAARGGELEEEARRHASLLRYEAAVGGAIPILHAMRGALVGNRISRIRGILNGTCNFILSRMESDGLPLEAALREAQALGFAEAEPSQDLSGRDAACKLLLLARHGFGEWFDLSEVHCRGIDRMPPSMMADAAAAGEVVRLVAEAGRSDGRITLRVAPVRISAGDPLYAVRGVTNAVILETDFAGTLSFTGPGAGGDATASALYADLVQVALARAGRPLEVEHRSRSAAPLPLPFPLAGA